MLFVGASLVLGVVGGLLYGLGYVVATSNLLSMALFMSASVLAIVGWLVWDSSTEREPTGLGIGAIAVMLAIAWVVSIPGLSAAPTKEQQKPAASSAIRATRANASTRLRTTTTARADRATGRSTPERSQSSATTNTHLTQTATAPDATEALRGALSERLLLVCC